MIRPVATEKAVRIIELNNTLVFEVNMKDTKKKIKEEFEAMFRVKVNSINVMIRLNKKYAYIKLNEKNPAIDIATKLGVI